MSEQTVKKYRCPKCKEIVTSDMASCPKCGNKFSWGGVSASMQQGRTDDTSNFLLKWQYLFKTLNYICPWVSLFMVLKNKAYAGSINVAKVKCYNSFKNHTIIACVVHALVIFAIFIYGLSMIKGQGGI